VKRLRLVCIFIVAFPPSIAFGGVRHLTFLYEAPTSAPGNLELENWITWKRITGPDRSDQVDFRHEFEYGVTDKLQVGVIWQTGFTKISRSIRVLRILIQQSS
jgi:hypothetical protein